jgi:hypothetical protein
MERGQAMESQNDLCFKNALTIAWNIKQQYDHLFLKKRLIRAGNKWLLS